MTPRELLAELIALEDLRVHNTYRNGSRAGCWYPTSARQQEDYALRMPVAWANARAALAEEEPCPLLHVGADEDGNATLEWWLGSRKMTLYTVSREKNESLLKSWGPNIETEMEFVPLDDATAVRDAFVWLGAIAARNPS